MKSRENGLLAFPRTYKWPCGGRGKLKNCFLNFGPKLSIECAGAGLRLSRLPRDSSNT